MALNKKMLADAIKSKLQSELDSKKITKEFTNYKEQDGVIVADTTIKKTKVMPDDAESVYVESIATAIAECVIDHLKSNFEINGTVTSALLPASAPPLVGGGVPGPVPVASVPLTIAGGTISIPVGGVS